MSSSRNLFIEPFYGGSHKQLLDLLLSEFGGDLFTLPPTKWHWRTRVSALHFALTIPGKEDYQILFASSVLNLCELVALRPDLAGLTKILYFHENQLVYPVRKQQDRDFQYGYNQILSCLVADKILFNSKFNLDSFLDNISTYLRLMPDYRPQGLAEQLRPKCRVLYFPIELPLSLTQGKCTTEAMPTHEPVDKVSEKRGQVMAQETIPQPVAAVLCSSITSEGTNLDSVSGTQARDENVNTCRPLHILWPHRWEHDKGPDEFSSVLMKLMDAGVEFRVSILGSHTNDIPESFQHTFPMLGHRLIHKGHLSREMYWTVLYDADVVVSTAHHEFFGVAMLEAVLCGCYPLCPNRLVYTEFYPADCLYNTEQQLFKRLKRLCIHPHLVRPSQIKMDFTSFSWHQLKLDYSSIFCV